MSLLDWGNSGDAAGWGTLPEAESEGKEAQQNRKQNNKQKANKGNRNELSPQQGRYNQSHHQEKQPHTRRNNEGAKDHNQPQVTWGQTTNDWTGGGAGDSGVWTGGGGDVGGALDAGGGGGGWNTGGSGGGDGWNIGGSDGGGWNTGGGGSGGGNTGGGGSGGGNTGGDWDAGPGKGGWDAEGGGDGDQWWEAANQSMAPLTSKAEEPGLMTHSRQQSQNQGRALTLADLVKTIVTGNPSRTLWYAATDLSRNLLGEDAHDGVKDLGSAGLALEAADRALYGSLRPANQRIHWTFSPMKDDRVASLLDWIQVMSYALGTLGLHHFLVTQQRGALISNVEFRNPTDPNSPAFDWLTFDNVVETRDKTLQESIAHYDPESQVLVFVFLLSSSGNSLAMWRRKLPVPNAVRKQNCVEVTKVINTLARRKYDITVDESPAKRKKKWFHVRW